jgi:hypothetical protein
MPQRKVSLNSTPEKKPSLASLKPDKAVGVAARKRAVKKIEAGMTTRITTTKVTAKAGEKKVVIKRAEKKNKAQPLPTADTILVLPSTISIRAREKALVLFEAVSKDFENSARQVAYISGLCFILLGASMSLAFTTPFSGDVQQQASTITSGSTTLSNTTQTVSNTTPTPIVKPTFVLLDPLPVEVLGKTTHRLDVARALHVDVKLYALDTNSVNGLQVDDDPNGSRFTFTLDNTQLKPGQYVAKLMVESEIDRSIHTFILGSFLVPYPPTNATSGTGSSAPTTTAIDDTIDTQVVNAVTPTSTTTTSPTIPTLRLRVPSGDLSGQLALKIEPSAPVNDVRLSVRSLKSITPILNSSAEFRNGAWYYFLNTENIPNGDYELVAHSRFNDDPIKSNAAKVRIANFLPAPIPEPAATAPVQTVPPVDTTVGTAPSGDETSAESTPLRTFSEFSLEEVSDFTAPAVEMDVEVEFEIDAVFAQYKDELRELLKRYAIAQQSGDPLMLQLALQALDDAKQRLVNDVLSNPAANHLADNIDEELGGRFDMLQKRIDTFEELRRTASNNESASDKDNDGISDYDEQFLYNSNPEAPDTDNDGILDGIEIMGGYNPTDPSAEAIIKYELPQESFAVIDNELLKVVAIAPVIRNDLNEEDPEVQAEIRGRGLPNSFVTLYIFSSPTIVTVRTDQDGSFVYTFEKELEDGEHEVYVAVTDNTGWIVAQSNPFKFIKEAQAFTPVDSEAPATTEVAQYNLQSLDVYNVIVGLGILALGLILLMLGVGLREREKMINPVPSNDLKAT